MTTFPDGFVWGASTSAYQIEGGVDLDGRVPSIWDTFSATPGRVRDGDTGAVACDHRRRFRDDVTLMASLELPAYHFSVAWPRVLGADGSGLDFYRALVDELLSAGIEPVVTLYHWDLPQSLEDAGGWPVRATAEAFAGYATVVGRALGDRVRRWVTVNEPWCVSMLGYAAGVHAPGRASAADAMAAAHHVLLAHGLAVDALRSTVRAADAEVAITLNPYPVVAADDRDVDADMDAVRRVDGLANRWWYDAVLRGCYPDDVLDDVSPVADPGSWLRDGDLAVIARPIDAVGVNYYRRYHVRHAPGASASPPESLWPGSPDVELVAPPGAATTSMGWAVEPGGLREVLVRLRADYGNPPVYVHENGAAFASGVDDAGDRIPFLDAHLRAALGACDDGVDLRGFFAWTLFDNFEWAEGYSQRFGIVDVDFTTQVRTPKASARWFASVAGANAV